MACGKNQDKGKMSKAQREAIAKGMNGKKKSADQKKKISEGMKKSPCPKKKKSTSKKAKNPPNIDYGNGYG